MIIQEMGCGIKGIKGNFTLAWRGGLLLAAVFGALCLSPAPAAAGLIVSFDLNSAKLDYAAGTGILTITENLGSDLLVRQEDGIDVLDSAKIVGGADFEFLFELTLTDETGPDNWSATGTLEFTDVNKTTNAISGSFASTSVDIYAFAGGVLQIEGMLSSAPILQNRGDPWVFKGEETIPGEHVAAFGADGIDKQITVNSPGAYDDGVVFVLKFGVGTTSLDTLFGADFVKTGGEVKGHITPEPATMSLLALGGLAVLKRRRCRNA